MAQSFLPMGWTSCTVAAEGTELAPRRPPSLVLDRNRQESCDADTYMIYDSGDPRWGSAEDMLQVSEGDV